MRFIKVFQLFFKPKEIELWVGKRKYEKFLVQLKDEPSERLQEIVTNYERWYQKAQEADRCVARIFDYSAKPKYFAAKQILDQRQQKSLLSQQVT